MDSDPDTAEEQSPQSPDEASSIERLASIPWGLAIPGEAEPHLTHRLHVRSLERAGLVNAEGPAVAGISEPRSPTTAKAARDAQTQAPVEPVSFELPQPPRIENLAEAELQRIAPVVSTTVARDEQPAEAPPPLVLPSSWELSLTPKVESVAEELAPVPEAIPQQATPPALLGRATVSLTAAVGLLLGLAAGFVARPVREAPAPQAVVAVVRTIPPTEGAKDSAASLLADRESVPAAEAEDARLVIQRVKLSEYRWRGLRGLSPAGQNNRARVLTASRRGPAAAEDADAKFESFSFLEEGSAGAP